MGPAFTDLIAGRLQLGSCSTRSDDGLAL
jgi:hypothetical protein